MIFTAPIFRRHAASVDSPGFTLMELVVVMVLISTVTALAVPKIRDSLFTDQLKATARGFIGLAMEVGGDARAEQAAVNLRYDPTKRLFSAVPSSSGHSNETTRRYPEVPVPQDVQVVDISSAHGGKQTLGELVIAFSAQGYVDKTIVHLRNDDGDELSVILSPFLGVIRLLDGYVSLDDDRYTLRN